MTTKNGIAVISGEGIILSNTQSALDIIADANYHANSAKVVLFAENICEDFSDCPQAC